MHFVFRGIFALSILILLTHNADAAGFFVKHVKTGMCIIDTSIIQLNGSWGNLYFLEFSDNCLHSAAQFRFLDSSAMLNLKRPGCLSPHYRDASGYLLDMFYLIVPNVSSFDEKRNVCSQDRAVTQTSWGGLSVKYKGYRKTTFQTWCAVPKTHQPLADNQGIHPYIGLTLDCNDTHNKRFSFGSVTCHGNMIKNANCPKDQYMVVKTASYRGLSDTRICGSSDEYSCEVDVTCLVKKQCDGKHECSITVDDNLFCGDLCPGLTKYLHFEYQCVTGSTSYNRLCGSLRELTNMSNSETIKAKEGDLVNLLCSAQGEPPITFTWKKDQKRLLESFVEKDKPYRSSLFVLKVKDETSFGNYICHIRNPFETITHTISVKNIKDTSSVQKLEDTNYKQYLIVIIVLAIPLVISIVFNVYFTCQNRRRKSSTIAINVDSKNGKNNATHTDDNPINDDDGDYEQIELNDEQSTYTALTRPAEEETVDKLYTHLNNIQQDYVNQEEAEQDYVNKENTEQDYVIQPESGM